MPHQRHRLHNVRDQHSERNIQSDMCSVVVTGERIFVRGQVGYFGAYREGVGQLVGALKDAFDPAGVLVVPIAD